MLKQEFRKIHLLNHQFSSEVQQCIEDTQGTKQNVGCEFGSKLDLIFVRNLVQKSTFNNH